jgi:ABC-type antimicrobial peptide transport system permease subunit
MFKNYIKTGWRNIRKNGFHSLINVFGLALGLAFTLLIAAYAWSELRVNKNLRNADRQYIIQSKWKDPNMGYELATLGALAKALREEYPTLVADYYRYDGITTNVSKNDKIFRESLQVGDTTLLPMFGFPLVHGDIHSALKEPFSVVITENRAVKYFGKTDVLGQTLTIESFSGSRHDFMISGVMKDPPENSVTHLNSSNDNHFYLSLSASDYFGRPVDRWGAPNIISFIELQPGITADDVQKPMQELIRRNATSQVASNLTPYLVPLKEYYLKKDNGLVSKMLYVVSVIALFILLMALINFVNISIAKSSTRMREVGVRKVLGGLRRQLMFQFFTESIILVFFASILALVIYIVANPFLSDIVGKSIPKLSSFSVSYIIVPISLIIVIGFLAGLYPSLVISGLKPVDSLKGKLTSIKENISFRKSLVGFQFFIASIVFVGAIVVAKQISLFFSKDLGYDKEYVVSAQVPRDWTEAGVKHMEVLRDEFAVMPEVKSVSLSWQMLNGWDIGKLPIFKKGEDSTRAIATQSMVTDEKYAETFTIPISAGHFFADKSDSLTVVINETAAKGLGWTAQEAVGKEVVLPGNFPVTIIGVTKDFQFGSMRDNIQPISFVHVDLSNAYRYLSFKLKPGNVTQSLAALQKKWSVLLPGAAFEYSFMDDALAKLYQSEIQLKKAAQAATALVLVIVMLGVVGLISLNIRKRMKEIGIRKILGASAYRIIFLFLKDFLLIFLIGGLISVPVAWIVMQGWLNNYAHRINLTLQPFLISTFVLALITSLVISLQIIRAAAANPVKSLRIE